MAQKTVLKSLEITPAGVSEIVPLAMSTNKTFTGRARHRRTRRSVRIIDRIARSLIAIGGIGTVVAVSTVCIFLLWVVVPLFLPAELGAPHHSTLPADVAQCLRTEMDDYRSLAWAIAADGQLTSYRPDNGEVIAQKVLFPETAPTTWNFGVAGRDAVCGFADGSVRTLKFSFATTFPSEEKLSEDLRELTAGKSAPLDGGLLTRTRQGQLRLQTAKASVSDTIVPAGGSAVVRADCVTRPTGRVCSVLHADGTLAIHAVRRRQNLLHEVSESKTIDTNLQYTAPADRGAPHYMLLSGQADNLYLLWDDGHTQRYDLHDLGKPQLAEETDLVPEAGERVTTVQFLPGRTTLVVGDTLGRVRAWFPTRVEDARTGDGAMLVAAHELRGPVSAVASLAISARSRLLAVGYADGSARVFHVTTERLLVDAQTPENQPLRMLALAPKGDALLALSGDHITDWSLAAGFHEVSFAALFRSIWYEGYDGPRHVWQSTGGGDDFEPKLGMIPLVFGTLKATFYSLLFAVPIALMSAVYTSEFLHARIKARIKPAIEMMASLPSVVLGFVAALVVAPFVEQVIPAILAGIMVVPFTYLLAAHLWQMLPPRVGILLARWRFALICATLPIGVLLSLKVGPLTERILFDGDLRSWLDGRRGSGTGGWVVMLLPLSALVMVFIITRRVNPFLRRTMRGASRGQRSVVELVKFAGGLAATIAGATCVALMLDSFDLDPRGVFLDNYVQRNALVVGFVMGFAIIPLIYTIADDALSTVPAHLRSASLGAGATPWQTAVRVIIPTAMSGLFSAVMIGLGRAVGETMIVLMAAGNTPIMDWNVFSGFQTLSASIATELPEAVQGSAHYRTLFVAALALFAITFVVNTIAEAVRLRFRRRAYEL